MLRGAIARIAVATGLLCASAAQVHGKPLADPDGTPPPAFKPGPASEPWRVECRQDGEVVLEISPVYRVWRNDGSVEGWQYITAEGVPIQGRIGTNVHCLWAPLDG